MIKDELVERGIPLPVILFSDGHLSHLSLGKFAARP